MNENFLGWFSLLGGILLICFSIYSSTANLKFHIFSGNIAIFLGLGIFYLKKKTNLFD